MVASLGHSLMNGSSKFLRMCNYSYAQLYIYITVCIRLTIAAEDIRNLAQSFDSKIPGAENLLVRQLGRYIFYPREE